MFFAEDRIGHMRDMILARTAEERKKALANLLPVQREDFEGVFKAMDGFPVTIRLLDPPLHEFLPRREELMVEIAQLEIKDVNSPRLKEARELLRRVEELHELNPMLGHRGCRLGITYPEISEMQARAIFEAAVNVQKAGVKVFPEVMIPLVGMMKEMENQSAIIRQVAEQVFKENGTKVEYMVGTMIELPRACSVADQIAADAEFFSFGTNDLTQTAYGFSRDDISKFLPAYIERGILKSDPFATIDQEGVGELMQIAVKKGRKRRSNLKIGICGEHGGDPASVEFCHKIGLNYVSCSPYRVLTARLAAAQAAAAEELKTEGGRTKLFCEIPSPAREPYCHVDVHGYRDICAEEFGYYRDPSLRSGQERTYCTLCNRSISFCARLSSDSDHNTLPLMPQFFSTALVKATNLWTLALMRCSRTLV